ncbi:MAG: lysophospholipid acyltransferase family protein [Hyphomonadaceae bacterium]|nr:lysophospholipid acyltransferase family protein [Hyphomonadaceae bacterium]
MFKALLGNPTVQMLIGRAIGAYMALVAVTTRWRRINQAAAEPFWADPAARLIIAVWHGRFFVAHKLWAFGAGAPKVKFLISRSRDGGVVTHAARSVGVDVVRGSAAKQRKGDTGAQQKGGVGATFELLRHIEDGGAIGMTPDGPRGPRMRAKMGVIQIARMAQIPLLPITWATRWRVVLNSWDRFSFPFPFGAGVLIWGNPIPPPPPDADAAEMERVRVQLENELNRITAEADRMMGTVVVEPAPTQQKQAPEPASP